MIDRISSGIPEIDSKIQGGFPKGSVISYYGTISRAMKYCKLKFVEDSEKNECLYINTKDSIDVILEEANQFQIKLTSIQFLDAVHWRTKRVNPKSQSKAQFEVSNLTDLNALLAKIMDACKSRSITKILFDSPSSILLYSTPGKEQVYKFFELLTAFLRSNQINMVYALEKGVHQDDIINTLHYLSDGALTFDYTSNNGKFGSFITIKDMTLTSIIQEKFEIKDFVS